MLHMNTVGKFGRRKKDPDNAGMSAKMQFIINAQNYGAPKLEKEM